MQKQIIESLIRQSKALELLKSLLGQELRLLKKDAPQAVAGLEFSIQDLLRQIAVERTWITKCVHSLSPGVSRLGDVLHLFTDEEQKTIPNLIASMDRMQQQCARQAAVNSEIAKALKEQSASLLAFFRKQVMPKVRHTYSNHGTWTSQHPSATLISGRM